MRQLTLIDQPLSSSITREPHDLPYGQPALPEKQINTGSITEVIISSDSAVQPVHLLPLLHPISIDARWLMWVSDELHASPSLDRRWVQALGVKEESVLHLTAKSNELLKISCKALAAATGHLIIEWDGDLNNSQFSALQKAANKGNSHALIIRRR